MPGLVVPTFSRLFVDDVLVGGATDLARALFLGMGVTVAVTGALTWLQNRHLLRLETKFAVTTSSQFLWHVMHLPMQFFSQRYAGDIGSRVAINDRIAYLLSGELAASFISACMAVFYAALMWQYDRVLSLATLATALLNVVALKYFSSRRVHLNQQLLHEQSRMLGTAMSGLQSVETLKAMGAESDLFAKWSGYQAKAVGTEQRLRVQTELLSAVPRLLMPISTACILGIGGLRVMDGGISMGMLIAFQALMLGFITPVNRMVDLGSTLQEVRGDLARLDDVLSATIDVSPLEKRVTIDSKWTAGAVPAGTRHSGEALWISGATGCQFRLQPTRAPVSRSVQPGAATGSADGTRWWIRLWKDNDRATRLRSLPALER